MNTIFRQVRQQLLTENLPKMRPGKFNSYVLYALGEILHVVVGNLFALQKNSWDQNRQERLEEVKILKSMHADFIQTKIRADQTFKMESRGVDYCRELIRIRVDKPETKDHDSISNYSHRVTNKVYQMIVPHQTEALYIPAIWRLF